MGQIDFLRATGVWAVGLVATMLISYVIDPSGLFATVQENVISIIAAALVLAVLTYWYFSGPSFKPSARAGLQLGAFMLVASFVFGGISMLVVPMTPEPAPIPYEGAIMIVCIVLALAVPALTAHWVSKR